MEEKRSGETGTNLLYDLEKDIASLNAEFNKSILLLRQEKSKAENKDISKAYKDALRVLNLMSTRLVENLKKAKNEIEKEYGNIEKQSKLYEEHLDLIKRSQRVLDEEKENLKTLKAKIYKDKKYLEKRRKQMEEIEKEKKELEEQKSELEAEINELERERAKIGSGVKRLREQKEKIEKEVEKKRTALTELQGEVERLKIDKEKLEKSIEEDRSVLSALESEMGACLELKDIEKKVEESRNELEKLEREIRDKVSEKERLERTVEGLKGVEDELKRKEALLSETTAEQEHLDKRLTDLKNSIGDGERELSRINESISRKKEEQEGLIATVDDLKNNLAHAQEDLERFSTELNRLREEIAQSNQYLSQIKEDITTLETTKLALEWIGNVLRGNPADFPTIGNIAYRLVEDSEGAFETLERLERIEIREIVSLKRNLLAHFLYHFTYQTMVKIISEANNLHIGREKQLDFLDALLSDVLPRLVSFIDTSQAYYNFVEGKTELYSEKQFKTFFKNYRNLLPLAFTERCELLSIDGGEINEIYDSLSEGEVPEAIADALARKYNVNIDELSVSAEDGSWLLNGKDVAYRFWIEQNLVLVSIDGISKDALDRPKFFERFDVFNNLRLELMEIVNNSRREELSKGRALATQFLVLQVFEFMRQIEGLE